jgi:diketogulonate reductase-like aldo/keto reductase
MDEKGYATIIFAVKNGVRLIDTCPTYENESKISIMQKLII